VKISSDYLATGAVEALNCLEIIGIFSEENPLPLRISL